MAKYIISIDQSTQGTKALLFDETGSIMRRTDRPHKQIINEKGWVSHDPEEIYSNVLEVVRELLEGVEKECVVGLGISNQRETSLAWNRITGKPYGNAVVWQCARAVDVCARVEAAGAAEVIRQKTGMNLSPYFPASKIAWLLENEEGAKEAAERHEICHGTIDSWLVFKLTEGKEYRTDYSNASRTMMYNINDLCWDQEILQRLDIPVCMLPEVRPSSGLYGKTDTSFLGGEIPIAGVAGDQQAALFGQTCFSQGEAKNTYGTGCFLLMNTGERPVFSTNGLVTTIAWGIDEKVYYALEGSIFIGGASVQWLRDELRLIDSAEDSEYMARKVPDTSGCYVVPAFTGLGAPYWNQYARGTIVGLTRGVNKYHIIRATLEAITYQVSDVLQAMEADSGITLSALKVDGGASANNFLMQTQADVIQTPVNRPLCLETTALGAAYLAGLAAGYWKDFEDIRQNAGVGGRFMPEISEEECEQKLAGWKRAVKCAISWTE